MKLNSQLENDLKKKRSAEKKCLSNWGWCAEKSEMENVKSEMGNCGRRARGKERSAWVPECGSALPKLGMSN